VRFEEIFHNFLNIKTLPKQAKFSIINTMFLSKLNEVLTSRTSWKNFVSDRLNFFSLGLAFLINIIHWAMIYIKIKPGSSNILLHYNVIYGTDLVDKGLYAYIIPGLALLFLIINTTVSYFIFKKEKLASYFLSMANIPVQLVFWAAGLILVLANVN
jgi:hypothetical protein